MKIIISVLACCLVAVMGLFLYYDYQLKNSQDLETNASPIDESVNAAATEPESTAASLPADEVESDKALPTPARQLKKLMSETASTAELDEKIQSANEAITSLDKALEKELGVQPVDEWESTTSSVDTPNSENEEVKQRLKNIRDHINKKQQQQQQQ